MVTIQAACSGFIYNDDSQVLLIKEAYGRFRHGPPGGFVEQGESPHAACIREVLEETGLAVSIDHLIGIRWVSEGREVPWINFAFRCTVLSGVPSIQDPTEIANVGWYNPYDPPSPITHTASLVLVPGLLGHQGLVLDH